MPNLHKLRQEHAELIELVDRVSVVIERPHPPTMGDFFILR